MSSANPQLVLAKEKSVSGMSAWLLTSDQVGIAGAAREWGFQSHWPCFYPALTPGQLSPQDFLRPGALLLAHLSPQIPCSLLCRGF